MASEKNSQNTQDVVEDSNIDQINNFVSGSDDENSNLEPENSSSKDSSEVVDLEPENTNDVEDDPDLSNEEMQDEESKSGDEDEKEKPVKNKDEKKSEKTDKNSKPKKVEQKHIDTKSKKPEKSSDKKDTKTLQENSKKVPVKKDVKTKPKIQSKPIITKKAEKKELKKMDKKEKHNSKHEGKSSKTKNIIMWSVIALLAIILIVALILISKNNSKEEPLANETNSEIAATVNGDPIYTKDVMNEYNRLSPVMKQVYTIDTILNKSIDDLLLYQEALNQDIKITEKEIEAEIDALKTANMLSDEEFKQALERQNLTIEDVEKLIERNLYIRELLNKSILQEIEITDKEAEEYYNTNIEQFKTPAQVTVQHILVMITDTVDDAKAKEKIDQINSELTDSNFCELVTKYSEDPGSVANCGKYTFAKGDFNNPEFENPSFDLKPGEKTIVKTVFGYHLIKKLEDIPAGTQELSKVQDQIKLSLRDSRAQEKFDALLTRLREEAEIVNYLNKNTQTNTETNTETSTTTTETSNVESNSASLDDFAKCLTEKGVKMYGAYWCPHCENQKEAFASSWQYVKYVECAVEGQPQVQTQECSDAEISGYPTWIINGRQYAGEQTLSRLGQLSGCSLP